MFDILVTLFIVKLYARYNIFKGALINFADLTGKHLCWSKACNFIKKGLQHRCLPVKFAKFLRTSFFNINIVKY